MSLEMDPPAPSLVGLCILGALVTGVVLLVPVLVLVRAAQIVLEARAR